MIRLSLNGLMDQKQREPAIRVRLGIQPSIPATSRNFAIQFSSLLSTSFPMFWTLSIDIIPLFQTITPTKNS